MLRANSGQHPYTATQDHAGTASQATQTWELAPMDCNMVTLLLTLNHLLECFAL